MKIDRENFAVVCVQIKAHIPHTLFVYGSMIWMPHFTEWKSIRYMKLEWKYEMDTIFTCLSHHVKQSEKQSYSKNQNDLILLIK